MDDIGDIVRQCEATRSYRKQEELYDGETPKYYCRLLIPGEAYKCCYGGKLRGIKMKGIKKPVGFIQCMYPNLIRR